MDRNDQYHIPRRYLDEADELLADQIEELRDETIREYGGHPEHEQESAAVAEILANGELLAYRNEYAKEL